MNLPGHLQEAAQDVAARVARRRQDGYRLSAMDEVHLSQINSVSMVRTTESGDEEIVWTKRGIDFHRDDFFQAFSVFEASKSLADAEVALNEGEIPLAGLDLFTPKDQTSILDAMASLKAFRAAALPSQQLLDDAISLGRRAVKILDESLLDEDLRPKLLDHLANHLCTRFQMSGNPTDIEESISLASKVLSLIPEDSLNLTHYRTNLSTKLQCRYNNKTLPLSISATPPLEVPASGALRLANLALSLLDTFRRTSFRKDLEEAVHAGKRAIMLLSPASDDRSHVYAAVSNILLEKYNSFNDLEDLRQSIGFCEQAIWVLPRDDPARRNLVTERMTRWKECFRVTDNLDDLKNVIVAFEECQSDLPYDEKEQLSALLGKCALRSEAPIDWVHFLSRNIANLEDIPAAHFTGVLGDNEYRRKTLNLLRSQLRSFNSSVDNQSMDRVAKRVLQAVRAEYTQRCQSMESMEAIADVVNGCVDFRFDVKRNNFDSVQQEVNELIKSLSVFGVSSYRLRYRLVDMILELPEPEASPNPDLRHTGDLTWCAEVDRLYKQLPKDDVGVIKDLVYAMAEVNSMSAGKVTLKLQPLWESACEEDLYVSALQFIRDAVASAKGENKGRLSTYLINLSQSLRNKFLRSSAARDIDSAIKVAECACASVADHTNKKWAANFLVILAMSLKSRYQVFGDISDLERSVQLTEKALVDNGDPQVLNHYGLIMRLSYRATNRLLDLEKGEKCFRDLLCQQPRDFDRSLSLNNLALILCDKHECTKDFECITEAKKLVEEAMTLLSKQHKDTTGLGQQLGNVLLKSFRHTGNVHDLDEAIRHAGKARMQVSLDAKAGGGPLSDLSELYLTRGLHNRSQQDIEEAISCSREALRLTAVDHCFRCDMSLQLAHSLAGQAKLSPSKETLQACIDSYVDVWNNSAFPQSKRIFAAREAAKHLVVQGSPSAAARVLQSAVELLALSSPSWLQLGDQRHSITSFSGIGVDAAMASLLTGDSPSTALEMLEQARGLVINTIIKNRGQPPAFVQDQYPEALKEFNRLRAELDRPAQQLTDNSHLRTMYKKMEQLLAEVRQLPGYERFLLPLKSEDLISIADQVPVVTVTISNMSEGVAFIVYKQNVTALRLPKLTYLEASERMADLKQKILVGSLRTFASRNSNMLDFLKWLWETIVGPVLEELGFTTISNITRNLPHVRWIGVGIINEAPFHIAGDYAQGSKCNALYRIKSSYISSFSSLAYSTDRRGNSILRQKTDLNLLAISMPETPGARPLSSATKEAAGIAEIAARASIHASILEFPSVSAVMEQLPLYNIVHFSCHGVSDPTNPSNSHLIFCDRDLTVGDIMNVHAAVPEVAFVAACSTAQSGHQLLADESIHIASSLQLVGFKYVIGTLWETHDATCEEIARLFYSALLSTPEAEDDWNMEWDVVGALHSAIAHIQDRETRSPLLWAPFVIFG